MTERRDAEAWDAALDWLLRLAEAPGDPATRAAFSAWEQADPAHAAAFARARAVWDLAGRVPAAAPARRSSSPWRRRALLGGGLAAAAATSALAPRVSLELAADLSTGVGEVSAHALPDGSRLTLDTASAVAFDPAGGRVELLAGRLFLEATPPLAVAAGGVEASVQAAASFAFGRLDHGVELAVAAGRVGLGAATVGDGWAVQVDEAGGTVARRRVTPADIGAWRSGRLVIEDRTVAEAIAELGRYHRGLMLVRDPGLAAARLSGVFDLAEPARALAAMVAPHGGRVRRFTDLLLVVEGA
jgi:transmembrane sensor